MNARQKRTFLVAIGMLAPNFLGFFLFTAGPVIFSLIMAFTNWNLTIHNAFSTEKVQFIGITNFQTILGGEEWRYFSKYFVNTVYLMIGIPIGIALSLVAAMLLNANVESLSSGRKPALLGIIALVTVISASFLGMIGVPPLGIFMFSITGIIVFLGLWLGQTAFRTLFYLPFLTSGVATFILWKALYRPETGPINRMLSYPLNFLTNLVDRTPPFLWQGMGWMVMIACIALMLWFVYSMARKLTFGDVGVSAFVFSVLGLGAVLAAVFGIGNVIAQLPAWIHPGGAELVPLLPPKWLVDTAWSKPAIMIMGVIMSIGSNNMLLYLAALNNVPRNLYEAASIDGANGWQSFWNITWPQLAPTTFFIVIMSTIHGLQGGFDMARVMTQGGPAGSTTTLAYYLYERGFTDFKLGLASSIAWTMFAMIFTLTLINWRFGNKMVND